MNSEQAPSNATTATALSPGEKTLLDSIGSMVDQVSADRGSFCDYAGQWQKLRHWAGSSGSAISHSFQSVNAAETLCSLPATIQRIRDDVPTGSINAYTQAEAKDVINEIVSRVPVPACWVTGATVLDQTLQTLSKNTKDDEDLGHKVYSIGQELANDLAGCTVTRRSNSQFLTDEEVLPRYRSELTKIKIMADSLLPYVTQLVEGHEA